MKTVRKAHHKLKSRRAQSKPSLLLWVNTYTVTKTQPARRRSNGIFRRLHAGYQKTMRKYFNTGDFPVIINWSWIIHTLKTNLLTKCSRDFQTHSQSLLICYSKAMEDWGEVLSWWRLRGMLGSMTFPWCNAFSTNRSQERLGTSLGCILGEIISWWRLQGILGSKTFP